MQNILMSNQLLYLPALFKIPDYVVLIFFQTKWVPFLSPALLVAMVAVPINIVPSILVKAYSQLIWFSEPLLMVMEAMAVVQVVTAISKMLVGYIEDNPLVIKVRLKFMNIEFGGIFKVSNNSS